MLNYHPANDLYHSIYRLFLITHFVKEEKIEWDRLRLMDFYFLFPHFIQNIKMPRDFVSYKKLFKQIEPPYEEIGSPKRMFYLIGTLQENAIRSLIAHGYVDKDVFLVESKVRIQKKPPEQILKIIKNDPKVSTAWFSAFCEIFLSIELTGESGLKDRSSMLEYKYDPI